MSDRPTLTLIELLPICAAIDKRDVLSFSVPTVSKKSFFPSCYNMWTGTVWDIVADIGYFENESVLPM